MVLGCTRAGKAVQPWPTLMAQSCTLPVWFMMKEESISSVLSVWLKRATGLAPWNSSMLGTATVPNLVERLLKDKTDLQKRLSIWTLYHNDTATLKCEWDKKNKTHTKKNNSEVKFWDQHIYSRKKMSVYLLCCEASKARKCIPGKVRGRALKCGANLAENWHQAVKNSTTEHSVLLAFRNSIKSWVKRQTQI